MDTWSKTRMNRLLQTCISNFDLNLEGLTVFTEAASGPYLYTPILAALAQANKVYAIAVDSKFASATSVAQQTLAEAAYWQLENNIEIVFEKEKSKVGKCDIITNSGFVRPIDRKMIAWMKPTAVIPLMWETWEFRNSDLDLEACKEHGILVLGTDESPPPLSLYSYCGFLGMKLLFDLGLEGLKAKILLLGSGGLGKEIFTFFQQAGLNVDWFSQNDPESFRYTALPQYFAEHGSSYDGLILAEHQHDLCLLGSQGLVSFASITEINPALCLGVIAGNINLEELKASGLHHHPPHIRPFGYVSYDTYQLGPRPVLELYAAGLRVGEVMARSRLSGQSLEHSAKSAMQQSLAMDFKGEHSWCNNN